VTSSVYLAAECAKRGAVAADSRESRNDLGVLARTTRREPKEFANLRDGDDEGRQEAQGENRACN